MKIATIDLFAGAGGLSIGAAAAGVDVRLLVELDPVAGQTLAQNPQHHGGLVITDDVRALHGEELRTRAGLTSSDPLLVIGGAPCQPFSKAAYWVDPGEDAKYRRLRSQGQSAARPTAPPPVRSDDRRTLVDEFWRVVDQSRADAFLFENVPSLLHPRHRPILDRLIAQAEATGFHTRLVRANAVEFGVAQRRERVFLLAARRARPIPPEPTHSTKLRLDSLPAVTVQEAFAPIVGDTLDEPETVVTGRWAQHLREIPPGWNYKHHTAWGGHPNPTFVTETRFWTFLLKLHPEQSSWTISANPGPWVGPFHWDNRRLRTAELAALQDFPSGFRFAGNRRERVRQIGNAVPVMLARRMVEQVVQAMSDGSSSRAHREAALVS